MYPIAAVVIVWMVLASLGNPVAVVAPVATTLAVAALALCPTGASARNTCPRR